MKIRKILDVEFTCPYCGRPGSDVITIDADKLFCIDCKRSHLLDATEKKSLIDLDQVLNKINRRNK